MKFQSWKHKEAAWKKIAPRAQEMEKETLYCRVQGNLLYAMEVRYNPSCRNSFNTEDHNYERGKERSEKADSIDSLQAQKLGAHQRAYENVKNYVLEHVIKCNEIIQLTFLRNLYIEDLAKSGFPNSVYRSEKLMNHLQGDKDISQAIASSKVPLCGCVEQYLIYSSKVTLPETVSSAYKLGTTQPAYTPFPHYKNIQRIKQIVLAPTAQELNVLKVEELLPEIL